MDLVSFEWYVDSDSFYNFPVEVVAYLAADSVCPGKRAQDLIISVLNGDLKKLHLKERAGPSLEAQ